MTSLLMPSHTSPMFDMPRRDPMWSLNLQKYHNLQSQHAFLQSLLAGEPLPMTRTNSVLSPPSSPTSLTVASSLSSPTSASASTDIEEKLFAVNQSLKAILTSLINCDTIKRDDEERAWIQDRLMHVEMELKGHRRRRSSAHSSMSHAS